MPNVSLKDWKPGLRKISLTHLLQNSTGMSLTQAKSNVDQLLQGELVVVYFDSRESAEDFLNKAIDLGAIADIEL